MEQVVPPLSATHPAAAGRGGSAGSLASALTEGEHLHTWRRLPDAVGLFACSLGGCQWFAVCPACLGSLDVALRLRDGIEGMALYWCPVHQGGGAHGY